LSLIEFYFVIVCWLNFEIQGKKVFRLIKKIIPNISI